MSDSTGGMEGCGHIALACHTQGQGEPLVLLHGGMGSWTHWVRNLPALGARFRVHALDAPGFGDSPSVPEDLDPAAYLDPLRAAVRRIANGGKVGLAGFSFGGAVAAMLAAGMPETIGRLALLAPGGFGVATGRRLDVREMPSGELSEAQRRDVLRHNLIAMMFAQPRSADDAAIDIQRANVARTRFDSRRFSLSAFTVEALPRIRMPMLLMYGEHDNMAWPSVEARIASCTCLKPDIRVERIAGAGHWLQYEAADAVNRVLLDFFSSRNAHAVSA